MTVPRLECGLLSARVRRSVDEAVTYYSANIETGLIVHAIAPNSPNNRSRRAIDDIVLHPQWLAIFRVHLWRHPMFCAHTSVAGNYLNAISLAWRNFSSPRRCFTRPTMPGRSHCTTAFALRL
jgi:hypothetical protein